MSFAEFETAVASGLPPPGLAPALLALWHGRRGDWDTAHAAVQSAGSRDAAWVHAYLHRKEGDVGNAGYWYRRAGKTMPPVSADLNAEWIEITTALISS